MHACPVCGYDEMELPPRRQNICNCCGTQFGYHDYFNTHEELRQKWINGGMKFWGLPEIPPPENWNPEKQLLNVTSEVKA